MKTLRVLLIPFVVAAGATCFAAEPAPATQPSTTTTQNAQANAVVEQSIRNIEQAPDPSAAVEAYAQAQASAPTSVEVKRAFVAKMVDLGAPALAEYPARDLTHRVPNDGLAWAVIAFTDFRRGFSVTALEKIAHASRLAPDEPFVQRTAGQLLAEYDRNSDRFALNDSQRNMLIDARAALANKPEFQMAYRVANDAYARAVPTTEEATDLGSTYLYNSPNAATYYDQGNPYTSGGYSNYSDNNYYYEAPYTYSYPYYGYGFWWGPGFIVHDFHHDHFHDFHDHFHHDDFHDNFHHDFHNGFHDGFHDGSHDGFHDGSHDGFHSGFMNPGRGGSFDRGDRYMRGSSGFSSGGGMSGGHIGGGGFSHGGHR